MSDYADVTDADILSMTEDEIAARDLDKSLENQLNLIELAGEETSRRREFLARQLDEATGKHGKHKHKAYYHGNASTKFFQRSRKKRTKKRTKKTRSRKRTKRTRSRKHKKRRSRK